MFATAYSAAHENVRVNVAVLLREIVLRVLGKSREYGVANIIADILRELIKSADVSLIVTQEIYVAPGDLRRVDASFGNRVIFDFKSSPREFDDAVRDAREKYLPHPRFKSAEYFIVTDWYLWRIYRVKRVNGKVVLEPIFLDIRRRDAEAILEGQIVPEIIRKYGGPLIPAHPDTVARLFEAKAGELVGKAREVFRSVKEDSRVKPLYSAYTQIMRMLYGEAGDDFFEDLFARHTIMHMIALASLARALNIIGRPEDLCSGVSLNIDVALPYLNWWRVVYLDGRYGNLKGKLDEVVKDIVLRVNLIDWEYAEREDVFRVLYEVLLDPETRRKIGEYYTPLWVVEYILREFVLKDKLVFDPFCGSGTFLVLAFHGKVDSGEDPDKAYMELIGFDINPLAVAIARAELILAYARRTGRTPETPPHIYHVDTLGAWFGDVWVVDPELRPLYESVKSNMAIQVNFASPQEFMDASKLLKSLSEIEQSVSEALNYAYRECSLNVKCLAGRIRDYVRRALEASTLPLTRIFLEHFEGKRVYERLSELIARYGGNSVWAIVLTSIYVPFIVSHLKPHIIVTNPPWIPITEFKAPYADKINEKTREAVKALELKRPAGVIVGSDVSTMALYKALSLAREGVGFVMNREQAFYHGSPMRAGILLTYAVLRKFKGALKLTDIDFDAFQHGIYPSTIIVKKGGVGEELAVVRLTEKYRKSYTKSVRLLGDLLEVERLNVTYNDYIEPSIAYFKENLKVLARRLGAVEIVPMGLYVRGLFGGERRRGAQNYAGLVLEEFGYAGQSFEFKLYNTSQKLKVPIDWLRDYGVDVYIIVYRGAINPFNLLRYYNVLLSRRGEKCRDDGEKCLKDFLSMALSANANRLSQDDITKIRLLINELRQGNVQTLNPKLSYAIYRCQRAFTAFTLTPENNMTVAESHVGFIAFNNAEKALYYTAVLNYLAYKVVEQGRAFIRDQFARPVLAIIISGLDWNSVSDDVRREVIELSRRISKSSDVKGEYGNQAQALKALERLPEFKRIVEIFDGIVNRGRLEEALKLVSGSGEGSEDSET